MAKRRSLVTGLSSSSKTGPTQETAFVYGNAESEKKPKPGADPPADASMKPAEPATAASIGRSPLTTRLRADMAAALKRASLERQLAGQAPHTVQDILEEALEPWLKKQGYLK
jgi:hypothetical protein